MSEQPEFGPDKVARAVARLSLLDLDVELEALYALVAVRRDLVHWARAASVLSWVRKVVHLSEIPIGISGVWAYNARTKMF